MVGQYGTAYKQCVADLLNQLVFFLMYVCIVHSFFTKTLLGFQKSDHARITLRYLILNKKCARQVYMQRNRNKDEPEKIQNIRI